MLHGTKAAYQEAKCRCRPCTDAYNQRHRLLEAPKRPYSPELVKPLQWHAKAACHGLTDLFFSPTPSLWEKAKAVCATCPVIAECKRDHADEDYGVWFGTDHLDRRAERLGIPRHEELPEAS